MVAQWIKYVVWFALIRTSILVAYCLLALTWFLVRLANRFRRMDKGY